MLQPLLILCGPQSSAYDSTTLLSLSDRIHRLPDSSAILGQVLALRQHWALTESRCPALFAPTASKEVEAVIDVIANKALPPPGSALCLFDSCITVLLHVTQLLELDGKAHFQILNRSGSDTTRISFQGFCVGLISAVAASSAASRSHFVDSIGNAILLAACIGSIVDRDNFERDLREHSVAVISVRSKLSTSLSVVENIVTHHPDVSLSSPQPVRR